MAYAFGFGHAVGFGFGHAVGFGFGFLNFVGTILFILMIVWLPGTKTGPRVS